MITQAGGDATNVYQKQLFVGQIHRDWGETELTIFLAKELHIALDDFENQIKKPIKIFPPPKEGQKKCAFIQVKDRDIHMRLLRELFKHEGTSLNIKESDQEEKKRKLFFGRLTDDITKDKVVDIIELVRPGASEWIEEQFPQVPPQVSGKSRTAFVQFATHQTAREVKESFKQLGEVNIQNINPEDSTKMTVLQEASQNGNALDLIKAVDYHNKTKRKELTTTKFATSTSHINLGKIRLNIQIEINVEPDFPDAQINPNWRYQIRDKFTEMAPAYVEPLIEPYIDQQQQFANRGDKRPNGAPNQMQRRHMMHFTPPMAPQNDIARARRHNQTVRQRGQHQDDKTGMTLAATRSENSGLNQIVNQ